MVVLLAWGFEAFEIDMAKPVPTTRILGKPHSKAILANITRLAPLSADGGDVCPDRSGQRFADTVLNPGPTQRL